MANIILSSGDILADRRFFYAMACLGEQDFAAAAGLFEQVIERAPDFAPAWFELGKARLALGRIDAAAAFGSALALDPEDRLGAGLHIARLSGNAHEAVMSPAYIKSLFDQYAGRFDQHLTGALAYHGPQLLFEAVRSLSGSEMRFGNTLDLGCGTGLCGAYFRSCSDRLEGCDLSPAMIEEAAKKRLYESLELQDAVSFLNAQRPPADLILAADVLVYLGDLRPVFSACASRLAHDGLFAFSIEACDGDSFRLGEALRFAHSQSYIRRIAGECGLEPALIQADSTRLDAGKAVPGFIAVLRHG